jgi:hypothetical protein
MTQAIKWQRGQYYTFYAKMKFSVGGTGNSVYIEKGDEFEYDGSVVRYAGSEFAQPGMRGAVKEGWVTLHPDEEDLPDARIPTRKVAKAQSVNRDLNNVQRESPQVMEQDSLDEETVLRVGDRDEVRDARTGKGHVNAEHNRRQIAASRSLMTVSASDVDTQDAVVISSIKTPAKLGKVDVAANPGMSRDIENISHEGGFGRYDGKRRPNQVIRREGVTITTNVGSIDQDIRSDEDEVSIVGKVRNSNPKVRSQEGVTIEDTSGPAMKPQTRKVVEMAKKAKVKDNPKLQKAVSVFADFPSDWNFFGKTEDKISKLKKLNPSTDFLNALYASESNAMKKALKKQYPKHFSS